MATRRAGKRRHRVGLTVALALGVLMPAISVATRLARAQENGAAGITFQDLLRGYGNPTRWPTYSGDYSGQRHSPLQQITPENVHRLAAQWTFQTGIIPRRGFEGTPLVVDGVLYLTGSNNTAWALDARTGRPLWRYRRELPGDLTYGAISPGQPRFWHARRSTVHGHADAHLVALNAKTGMVVWDVVLADYKIGYAATAAPLVIKDKVIVGISGGEFPTRGFIDAYDPSDRRTALALLHDSGARRTGQRDVASGDVWRAAAAARG